MPHVDAHPARHLPAKPPCLRCPIQEPELLDGGEGGGVEVIPPHHVSQAGEEHFSVGSENRFICGGKIIPESEMFDRMMIEHKEQNAFSELVSYFQNQPEINQLSHQELKIRSAMASDEIFIRYHLQKLQTADQCINPPIPVCNWEIWQWIEWVYKGEVERQGLLNVLLSGRDPVHQFFQEMAQTEIQTWSEHFSRQGCTYHPWGDRASLFRLCNGQIPWRWLHWATTD